MKQFIFQIQLFSTLAMVGLIWFVQLVHYPMFAQVGRDSFPQYERIHQQRTTWVVAPLMLAEALTAGLMIWMRPSGISAPWVLLGIVLLMIAWLVTALASVPAHAQLAGGFDEVAHRRLVLSNWLRTAAWTARGLLLCGMAWRAANGGP